MSNYFQLVSQELLNKLEQIKTFIKKHNPTIGVLTEEILRDFLGKYLPRVVSVEQGFILKSTGELSRQCDIIIYDSQRFSPFYRINNIVVVPEESVVAVVEVKTTINQGIFHDTIKYFEDFGHHKFRTYLFIYNAVSLSKLLKYFHSYKHKGTYQMFDHDTFPALPDEITGINPSYHLRKDYVIHDMDEIGYTSWRYEDVQGEEINALQHFYLSLYEVVEDYVANKKQGYSIRRESYYPKDSKGFTGIPLFQM